MTDQDYILISRKLVWRLWLGYFKFPGPVIPIQRKYVTCYSRKPWHITHTVILVFSLWQSILVVLDLQCKWSDINIWIKVLRIVLLVYSTRFIDKTHISKLYHTSWQIKYLRLLKLSCCAYFKINYNNIVLSDKTIVI